MTLQYVNMCEIANKIVQSIHKMIKYAKSIEIGKSES